MQIVFIGLYPMACFPSTEGAVNAELEGIDALGSPKPAGALGSPLPRRRPARAPKCTTMMWDTLPRASPAPPLRFAATQAPMI